MYHMLILHEYDYCINRLPYKFVFQGNIIFPTVSKKFKLLNEVFFTSLYIYNFFNPSETDPFNCLGIYDTLIIIDNFKNAFFFLYIIPDGWRGEGEIS